MTRLRFLYRTELLCDRRRCLDIRRCLWARRPQPQSPERRDRQVESLLEFSDVATPKVL